MLQNIIDLLTNIYFFRFSMRYETKNKKAAHHSQTIIQFSLNLFSALIGVIIKEITVLFHQILGVAFFNFLNSFSKI